MSTKDKELSVGRKTPVFLVLVLVALVAACMFIVGCAGSNDATGGETSSSATASSGGIDAVEFVTGYKSDLSDEDIKDLLDATISVSNEIWDLDHGYGKATEESVSKDLGALDKTFSAIAKKYDVTITGSISDADVDVLKSMLKNAYGNTEMYKNAVEGLNNSNA